MSSRNSSKKRRRHWLPIVALVGMMSLIVIAARKGKLKTCCEHRGQAGCRCCSDTAVGPEDEQASFDLKAASTA
jgi:hypothetical protein